MEDTRLDSLTEEASEDVRSAQGLGKVISCYDSRLAGPGRQHPGGSCARGLGIPAGRSRRRKVPPPGSAQ